MYEVHAPGDHDPVDPRERWGDLPVHVRDVFRAEGNDELPLRYRDFIEAYYRRLRRHVPDGSPRPPARAR